jgi:tRNA-dihydrouridine synthase
MNFYFAPMEGVTGYIYRNAHHAFFNHIDRYYAPFIVATQNDSFKTKEINDILPENNQGITLIPQLLANNANDFIRALEKIKQYGYDEINLNLGCPAATVVSKNKGSGFLAKREELDKFLDEIFHRATTKISVKTRLGKDHPDEFYELIEIFNKYPIKELIVHPRIQKDFYKNKANRDMFKEAVVLSKNPICYNGDIFTANDFREFIKDNPSVNSFMMGRGLVANPGLIGEIKDSVKLDKHVLKEFHDKIYIDYKNVLSGDKNTLYKMKELWFYMISMFSNYEKYYKKIRKAERLHDYDEAISALFKEQVISEDGKYSH